MMQDIIEELLSRRATHFDSVSLPYASGRLTGVRVVFFDIYGTILLSAAGEVGSAMRGHEQDRAGVEKCFASACCSAYKRIFSYDQPLHFFEEFYSLYRNSIRATHKRMKGEGVSHPEIDIREIWHEILSGQSPPLAIDSELLTAENVSKFSMMIELITNPVQLAPYIEHALAALRKLNIVCGIISNAQFYTPLILSHLTSSSLVELGFTPALCYWSYQKRLAKPALSCFEQSVALAQQHCDATANEMLYIGNDVRNDIVPASAMGMHTCLYCGDNRSVRLYPEDDNSQRADMWITDYRQLPALLGKPMEHQ